jgi:uncharacterized protein YndB with AHSA1/START domain
VTEAGFEIVRVFDAPRERVWAEWTRPDAFADWFGGADVEVVVAELDARAGGALRATMHFDGREIHWLGEYLEVDPPRRLRLAITDRPAEPAREIVTVELADLGDGRTEMRLEQRGHMAPPQYRPARDGWGRFLDRIAERLSSR